MAEARELVSTATLGKASRDSYMGMKIFQLLTTISITCSRILEKNGILFEITFTFMSSFRSLVLKESNDIEILIFFQQ